MRNIIKVKYPAAAPVCYTYIMRSDIEEKQVGLPFVAALTLSGLISLAQNTVEDRISAFFNLMPDGMLPESGVFISHVPSKKEVL